MVGKLSSSAVQRKIRDACRGTKVFSGSKPVVCTASFCMFPWETRNIDLTTTVAQVAINPHCRQAGRQTIPKCKF